MWSKAQVELIINEFGKLVECDAHTLYRLDLRSAGVIVECIFAEVILPYHWYEIYGAKGKKSAAQIKFEIE